MEKRLLLALALSFLVLLLWSKLFTPEETQPLPQKEQKVETVKEEKLEKGEVKEELDFPTEIIRDLEEREILKENDYLKVLFSNKGAKIKDIRLKKYLDYDKNPLRLYPLYNPKFSPLQLLLNEKELESKLSEEFFKVEDKGDEVAFVLSLPEIYIKKIFKLKGSFLDFSIEVKGNNNENIYLSWGPGLRVVDPREENNKFLLPADFIWRDFKGIERKPITKFGKKLPELNLYDKNLNYFGLEDSYFAVIFEPKDGLKSIKVYPEKDIYYKTKLKYGYKREVLEPPLSERVFYDEERKEISLFGIFEEKEKNEIKKGLMDQRDIKRLDLLFHKPLPQLFLLVELEKSKASFEIYLGAKDYEFLKKNKPEFAEIVSFGFFGFIAKPLLWVLKGINSLIGNWGFSIIILTLILRILLYPVNHKQIVSMKKMQNVQPKIDAIRKKYKNALRDMEERAKMNQEIMEVYKKEGINPLGGCLPLAIQIPILWAFYSLLSTAIELRNSPFIFWIKDLSSRDPYYITPILMGLAMFIQQKMTPTTGTPSQRFLINTMPIFFTFLFLNFPSGVVLYWFFNTLLQILQTIMYKWHMKEA